MTFLEEKHCNHKFSGNVDSEFYIKPGKGFIKYNNVELNCHSCTCLSTSSVTQIHRCAMCGYVYTILLKSNIVFSAYLLTSILLYSYRFKNRP